MNIIRLEGRVQSAGNAGEAALDAAVDEAIAACDGDPRAAVRALLVANDFLGAEIERLRALTSTGFARGRLSLRDLP